MGIRREETDTALSSRSINLGVGLLQFTPATFANLNSDWKMVPQAIETARRVFLFDPKSNLELGARWFHEKLLATYKDTNMAIALAVMEHNAGRPPVKQWIDGWQAQNRLQDVEFVIDSIRFQQTRRLVRETIGTMLLIDASGRFGEFER